MEWLHGLLAELGVVATRDVPVNTMNGRPALATQLLVSRGPLGIKPTSPYPGHPLTSCC